MHHESNLKKVKGRITSVSWTWPGVSIGHCGAGSGSRGGNIRVFHILVSTNYSCVPPPSCWVLIFPDVMQCRYGISPVRAQ